MLFRATPYGDDVVELDFIIVQFFLAMLTPVVIATDNAHHRLET